MFWYTFFFFGKEKEEKPGYDDDDDGMVHWVTKWRKYLVSFELNKNGYPPLPIPEPVIISLLHTSALSSFFNLTGYINI